jgi:hypothetical protein
MARKLHLDLKVIGLSPLRNYFYHGAMYGFVMSYAIET